MRGTLCRCGLSTRRIGIIPAYAGNTCVVSTLACPSRDHPRICGEHFWLMALSVPLPGSSPHMRGTPRVGGRSVYERGIIPAYAGNTAWIGIRAGSTVDHPRICGEHFLPSITSMTLRGSSPHMRGTRGLSAVLAGSTGIIPAYAGNTHRTITTPPPPDGIIPAYAGNTYLGLPCKLPSWDHPRICGEHHLVDPCPEYCQGSSPHMRGTPSHRLARREHTGIIPAYAGNTWVRFLVNSPPEDHPRICGEHSASPPWWRDMGGSSPHMRGTPVRVRI